MSQGTPSVSISLFCPDDVERMRGIWNEVVRAGNAFPQVDELSPDDAAEFFASQSASAVAKADGCVVGLYIVHPNNVGRCGHIANASYAVSSDARGLHVGEALVRDSLERARDLGFRVMQFNAVVASNAVAHHLYKKIGFEPLGVIPGGFLNGDGVYEDIVPYCFDLTAL